MLKTTKLLVALGFSALIIYMVYSSFGFAKVNCEVCMELNGRKDCRTAWAASREEAIRTARDTACSLIANGRTENIRCGGTKPARVMCSE